jgi:hypothetical protein
MPSRYVRIPALLAVEPLEVMINQRTGRILSCVKLWESQWLTLTWYHYNMETVEVCAVDADIIIEVDLNEHIDRYILSHAAELRGMTELAAALRAGDIDRAEELLRALEN